MEETKVWYMSLTLWGAIVTVLAAIGGLFGIDIDADTQKQIIEYIVLGASALGGLIAAYGRIRAKKIVTITK